MATVSDVKAQYDAFPYPQAEVVAQQLPDGFTLGTINFLLSRRGPEGIPANARIWVAGCGTQQGAEWALSNPDAEIVATDLSDKVLAIASDIASQVGASNVRFEQKDIATCDYEAEFDLVVSTGVLHHLPDPSVGMARVRQALKPTGAAVLMLYSAMHRGPLEIFRETLALLEPSSDADVRYDTAIKILEQMIESPECAPAGGQLLQTLWPQRDKNRPFVADALLHPLEHAYDIDSLVALLAGAGLSHRTWRYPSLWDIKRYLKDPDLVDRVEKLSPVDQWRFVYNAGGRRSPLLELIAEPADVPPRERYIFDEMLAMKLTCSGGDRVYRIKDNRLVDSVIVPPYDVKDDKLRIRALGVDGLRRYWSIPEKVKAVLEACDGTRTIGQLLQSIEGFERDELIQTIARLSPTGQVGLLAPALV